MSASDDAGEAKRGTIWLTVAQLWHAVSGYVVFVTAARILGPEDFGDFGLISWTMTALEVFVVTGVPRAVSYFVASRPEESRGIALRGLRVTLALGGGMAVLLLALAPTLAALWGDPKLATATRISALDFVAFATFAVLVQAVNGLRLFGRQAAIWMLYSSAKVAFVVGFIAMGGGITGGILGYVLASTFASMVAVLLARLPVGAGRVPTRLAPARFLSFGVAMACQALSLMLMLTLDLWATKWATDDRTTEGAYVAASTLARVLYFVFVAVAEVALPTVVHRWQSGRRHEATETARDVLRLLLCVLLPATGLATGAAPGVLEFVYGAGQGYGAAAPFLLLLAPAAAALTLAGVLASLVVASGRANSAALLLLTFLALDAAAVFILAERNGAQGAALGTLVVSGLAMVALAVATARIYGAALLPWRTALPAAAVALAIHMALAAWAPSGWLLLPAGALLGILGVGILAAVGAFSLRGLRGSTPGSTGSG